MATADQGTGRAARFNEHLVGLAELMPLALRRDEDDARARLGNLHDIEGNGESMGETDDRVDPGRNAGADPPPRKTRGLNLRRAAVSTTTSDLPTWLRRSPSPTQSRSRAACSSSSVTARHEFADHDVERRCLGDSTRARAPGFRSQESQPWSCLSRIVFQVTLSIDFHRRSNSRRSDVRFHQMSNAHRSRCRRRVRQCTRFARRIHPQTAVICPPLLRQRMGGLDPLDLLPAPIPFAMRRSSSVG